MTNFKVGAHITFAGGQGEIDAGEVDHYADLGHSGSDPGRKRFRELINAIPFRHFSGLESVALQLDEKIPDRANVGELADEPTVPIG